MIDTDKYEGHTPVPWDAKPTKSCAWRWVSLGLQVPHDECFSEENIVNLALIADAPLLLAEVKRLRKQLEDCKRQIQFTADWIRDRGEDTHAKELDEFLEWMK
tara:strand:+ start:19 stop:327 length:309 start_codon:yes stop_codon:yes gene_type:complete